MYWTASLGAVHGRTRHRSRRVKRRPQGAMNAPPLCRLVHRLPVLRDFWEEIRMKLPHRRQFLHFAAGAAALPAVSRFARAQVYPSRPVTIVVPFAAGGPTDTLARTLAERMRVSLGNTVIIE